MRVSYIKNPILAQFSELPLLHLLLVVRSRCLVATTIRSSSAPLVSLLHLNDTYRVDDAFKVHLTLTSRIMVALFVVVMTYPSLFFILCFGYRFLFCGCDSTLVTSHRWYDFSLILILRLFFMFVMYFTSIVLALCPFCFLRLVRI